MNENLILVITTGIASFITWLFTRRKTNAEITSIEIENNTKMQKQFRDLADGIEERLHQEIETLRKENCDLEKKFELVIRENKTLKKQMGGLKRENESLKKQMGELQRENKKLQEQLIIFNKNNPS